MRRVITLGILKLLMATVLALQPGPISCLGLIQDLRAQEPPAQNVTATTTPAPVTGFTLEDGTPVRMRITRTISSADAQVNDRVDFETLDDVKIGDVMVIPHGSIAWGTVTEAVPKKRMARGGKLNVNIDSVRLVDGEKAALRAVKEVKGGGHTGAMTGGMVATGIVFFPAAPLFLFMHGKDITIPKGTEITAYISGNIPLDKAKFLAATSGETPTSGAEVTPAKVNHETASVAITSDPAGADISIDGKYVGSTPSTVHISAGQHTVVIEKPGYTRWDRSLELSAGSSITVNAALVSAPAAPSAPEPVAAPPAQPAPPPATEPKPETEPGQTPPAAPAPPTAPGP